MLCPIFGEVGIISMHKQLFFRTSWLPDRSKVYPNEKQKLSYRVFPKIPKNINMRLKMTNRKIQKGKLTLCSELSEDQ